MNCTHVAAVLSSLALMFSATCCAYCATGAGDASAQAKKLQSTLHALRNGEDLFRNLNFEYVEEMTCLATADFLKGLDVVVTKSLDGRVVFQGKLHYYSGTTKQQSQSGTKEDRLFVRGYDGERNRSFDHERVSNTGVANIRFDATFQHDSIFSPYRLAVRAYHRYRLSEVLDGTMLKEPQSQGIEISASVAVDGQETIDGIPCVRLVHTKRTFNPSMGGPKGKKLKTKDIYWLGEDRHYMLVKVVNYSDLGGFFDHPVGVSQTSDWREVEPGIFVPFKAVLTGYNLVDGVVRHTVTYVRTVKDISLSPNYDVSLFREIAIPGGLPVYVVKGGKIVQNYLQPRLQPGQPAEATNGSSWSSWLVLGMLALVAALFGSWCFYRRLRPKGEASFPLHVGVQPPQQGNAGRTG